jgi:hypothetical protein
MRSQQCRCPRDVLAYARAPGFFLDLFLDFRGSFRRSRSGRLWFLSPSVIQKLFEFHLDTSQESHIRTLGLINQLSLPIFFGSF